MRYSNETRVWLNPSVGCRLIAAPGACDDLLRGVQGDEREGFGGGGDRSRGHHEIGDAVLRLSGKGCSRFAAACQETPPWSAHSSVEGVSPPLPIPPSPPPWMMFCGNPDPHGRIVQRRSSPWKRVDPNGEDGWRWGERRGFGQGNPGVARLGPCQGFAGAASDSLQSVCMPMDCSWRTAMAWWASGRKRWLCVQLWRSFVIPSVFERRSPVDCPHL